MARGSLHSFEFNFSRVRRGLVFSWVCTINACLVRLHLSCDFSASFFFYIYIYIYAFSRRFYPKRLTIAFRLYIFISTCVPWESNPQPFAQLTQCSTTEPHRNTLFFYPLFTAVVSTERFFLYSN